MSFHNFRKYMHFQITYFYIFPQANYSRLRHACAKSVVLGPITGDVTWPITTWRPLRRWGAYGRADMPPDLYSGGLKIIIIIKNLAGGETAEDGVKPAWTNPKRLR